MKIETLCMITKFPHRAKRPINPLISFLFGISVCLLSACGARTNDPVEANADNLSLALAQIVTDTVLPTVEGFAEQSDRFSRSAEEFCKQPDTAKLRDLQSTWRDLSAQWYKLALYNFGPVSDDIIFPKINFIDSLRQRGIDYTATVRTDIRAGIESSEALDAEFFRKKDFNRVGLLALELLSFETTTTEHSTVIQNILTEYQVTPRKCAYLKGMAALNVENADYIREGWQSNYLSTGTPYKTLFVEDQLSDEGKPVPTLLIALQNHFDYLAKRNVATVGAKVADYSYQNIKSSVDEVNAILNGSTTVTTTATNTRPISFFDIMSSAGSENSVAIVKDNITAIYQAIQNKNTAQLNASLALLDGNFKREINQGLDVELGINFTDGD